MQLVRKSLEWFLPHLKAEWASELSELLQKWRDHQGEEPFVCDAQLSDKVLNTLQSSLKDLEPKVFEKQAKVNPCVSHDVYSLFQLFDEWRDRRHQLIETQATTLNLQLRLVELKAEEQKTRDQLELLQFFDNRFKWESMAKEKEDLFEELEIGQESEELTEEKYAITMFDKMRDRIANRRAQK